MTAISGVTDPDAVVLWPKILWWNYEELTTPVQEALKNATKAALRSHIDTYLAAAESLLAEAEQERTKYSALFDKATAVALDGKIKSHREARDVLEAIKNQVDVD